MKDKKRIWTTSRRDLELGTRALVMGILNVTPDSFSDGGGLRTVDDALRQAETFIEQGADILDVGGESTRPGSARVSVDEESRRVAPVIEAIAKRFDIPVSVDTSKSAVAEQAVAAGAEIINDISAMRFDEGIGEVAARKKTGLVLMHSRGEFESMHNQPEISDIIGEVCTVFHSAIAKAAAFGIEPNSIVLDVGIGFSKTQDQNLELIAKLDKLAAEFPDYPILVGTSRKSFIGKILNNAPVDERLMGSLATAAIAIWNGASIVRVHDVKETVEAMTLLAVLKDQL